MGVHPEDREKKAFTCLSGLFQFKVLPFKLTNAHSNFEYVMGKVLAGLHFDICLIYLDDVIAKSDEFDSHIINLRSVFERIRKASLTLSPKKNVFHFNKGTVSVCFISTKGTVSGCFISTKGTVSGSYYHHRWHLYGPKES